MKPYPCLHDIHDASQTRLITQRGLQRHIFSKTEILMPPKLKWVGKWLEMQCPEISLDLTLHSTPPESLMNFKTALSLFLDFLAAI